MCYITYICNDGNTKGVRYVHKYTRKYNTKICQHAGSRSFLHTHTHTHTDKHCQAKNLVFAVAASILLISPSFSNIGANDSSASCDNSTIGASSGNTTLEAQWQANTITLKWYNDGEQFTPTNSSAAGECTYDAPLVLPENTLSKEGYTFDGWKIRRAAAAPQCDFSGLSDTTTKGKAFGFTRLNGDTGYDEVTYGLTQGSGEWASEFYHGIVKGQARCSTIGSGYSEGQTGEPTDDLGNNGAKYCWCKMTSYTPKPWIYDTGDASSSPISLTGYTNKDKCKEAIRAITGLNSTNANTLLNNASDNNPQLITNATGANLAYLTDMGCTTSGEVTGHFGELGNACPVSSSSWVFYYYDDIADNCALDCAPGCSNRVRANSGYRAAVFGGGQ